MVWVMSPPTLAGGSGARYRARYVNDHTVRQQGSAGGPERGSDDDPVVLPEPDVSDQQRGTVEIDIPSRLDLVAVVRMVVAAATNAVEALEGDRLDDLRWVTSEATTNAIEANLLASPEGRVQVSCEVDDGVVRLSVRDEGPGMPEQYEVPDITHPDRLLIEGAFGIPLMERLSSACQFVSAASGTTVNMELYQ